MHLDLLIEAVESSADWRTGKAAQYPDDKRNRTSSAALNKLAKRLRELAATNEHALAYEAVVERLVELDEIIKISEHQTHYIGRYGFDYPTDGDPEEFLQSLTEEYQEWVKEAEEQAAEEERERAFQAAREIADEAAKEMAAETAKGIAEEAARAVAQAAYEEAYKEAYKEAYDEAYKEALIDALQGS